MSGKGVGYVRPEPLESGLAVGYVWCPKLDSPIYKTGYSGFDRTENYGRT
jgi:hypothetical protein